MSRIRAFNCSRVYPWSIWAVVTVCCFNAARGEDLFKASVLTVAGRFTEGIEGPDCDFNGLLYAVNYSKQGTVGRVAADGKVELYLELPGKSVGNGIRFDKQGFMYIADYTGHNVLRVHPSTRKIDVYAHNPHMNQPNDLAIRSDGTLFASDPNWKDGTGQLWRIDRDGSTHLLAEGMGTTNGIDVSPDGKTLYVNESSQRNIWAFEITPGQTLSNKRLLRKFEDFGFDGMRCDVDGNLYVTRHGKGTVLKLSPTGEELQEIDVLGAKPSNICFGGPDGKTAYVTEVEHQRIVQFRVDRPGLQWQILHAR
jgi:gluconolactonase